MKNIINQGIELPPPDISVYYTDELRLYFPGVAFGINCVTANPAYVRIKPEVIMAHQSSITAVTAHNDRYYTPLIEVAK